MQQRFKRILGTRHIAERTHTVCMLSLIEYMLAFSASQFMMTVAVTSMVLARELHLALLTEAGDL